MKRYCVSCGSELDYNKCEWKLDEEKLDEEATLTCPVCNSEMTLSAVLTKSGKEAPEAEIPTEEPEGPPEEEPEAPEMPPPGEQTASPEEEPQITASAKNRAAKALADLAEGKDPVKVVNQFLEADGEKPPGLFKTHPGYKKNLDTIIRAAKNGDLAAVEATKNDTGERVSLLAAVQFVGGEYEIVPLAQMFTGNPYEQYTLPESRQMDKGATVDEQTATPSSFPTAWMKRPFEWLLEYIQEKAPHSYGEVIEALQNALTEMGELKWVNMGYAKARESLMGDDLAAVETIESTTENTSQEELLAAFQHLVDRGIVWNLEGWYGRTAKLLIDRGMINGSVPADLGEARLASTVDLTPSPAEYRHLLTIVKMYSTSRADKQWADEELRRLKDVKAWRQPRDNGSSSGCAPDNPGYAFGPPVEGKTESELPQITRGSDLQIEKCSKSHGKKKAKAKKDEASIKVPKTWEGDLAVFQTKIFGTAGMLNMEPDEIDDIVTKLREQDALKISGDRVILDIEKAKKCIYDVLSGEMPGEDDVAIAGEIDTVPVEPSVEPPVGPELPPEEPDIAPEGPIEPPFESIIRARHKPLTEAEDEKPDEKSDEKPEDKPPSDDEPEEPPAAPEEPPAEPEEPPAPAEPEEVEVDVEEMPDDDTYKDVDKIINKFFA